MADAVPQTLDEALAQLAEARATLRAIGAGEVDAFLVSDGHDGHRVFTLSTADRPYRMFVENMRDGAATITDEGIVLYANEQLAELLGVGRETIVGTPLDRFVLGDEASSMHDLAGSSTSRAATEFGLVDAAGLTIPVLVGVSALEVDGAHVKCLTFTDLRAQRAQEMAALGRDRAERANRAKSEFLSRMSHELRTPLNTVLGFGQLLLRDDLTPDQRESVGLICKAGDHLLDLINDVLDISRIEAGALRLSLEPVNLREVVDSALALMRPQAEQRKIRVPAESRVADEIYVHADRQRVLQILLNLLSNAVKYNRAHGTIELSWSATEGTVSLSVTDTGPGISEASLAKLFVPFERLGAEATAVEGTGVGLALSRTLSQEMAGTLTALSTVGEGSTFTLVLPAGGTPHEPRPANPHEAPRRSGSPSTPLTVLVIEDDVANIRLLERIVKTRPHTTLLTAIQGRLGLELASQHHPNLILLGLHLPDLQGREVLARLRSQPSTQAIPVVVCSGDASPEQARASLESGASAYLAKPLDLKELLDLFELARGGNLAAPGME